MYKRQVLTIRIFGEEKCFGPGVAVLLRKVRELVSKFAGGILSVAAGLSLGREGPSVQIGSYIGSLVSVSYTHLVHHLWMIRIWRLVSAQ